MMVPINIFDEKLDHLAITFGCDKGSLPSTYLGLPLGITKPITPSFKNKTKFTIYEPMKSTHTTTE
jgi:hypothetical protein